MIIPPYKILLASWLLAAGYQLSPSEGILIVGAIIFAWVTWRGQRGTVLRNQNKDLLDRNQFLEAENLRVEARNTVLEGRTDLTAIEASLRDHDTRMMLMFERLLRE